MGAYATRTGSPSLGRRVACAAAIVLLGALLAACTSSSPSATKTASSGATASLSSGPSSPAGSSSSSAPTSGGATTAPATGGINQTVPSGTLTTERPIPLSSPASFGNGVNAKITSIKAVNAPARGIGEIAGPGVRIALSITNDTAKRISLDNVSITIENAQKDPGVQMSASQPASGTLAAHHTAKGVYVFTIPKAHRNPLTVNMSYSVETPVVLFVGTVR